MLVVPDEGALELLDFTLRAPLVSSFDYSLRLFANNVTPDHSSTVASFLEPTWIGYFRQPVTRAAWNAPTIDGDHAFTQYGSAAITWLVGGPGGTVYGYFVVDVSTNKCLWAELAPAPLVLTPGATVGVLLRFNGRSLFFP